jgi:hypothetical protein
MTTPVIGPIERVEFIAQKALTNAICVSGSNLSHMEFLLKKKGHVSKKEMKKALSTQKEYLHEIEEAKNRILNMLKS